MEPLGWEKNKQPTLEIYMGYYTRIIGFRELLSSSHLEKQLCASDHLLKKTKTNNTTLPPRLCSKDSTQESRLFCQLKRMGYEPSHLQWCGKAEINTEKQLQKAAIKQMSKPYEFGSTDLRGVATSQHWRQQNRRLGFCGLPAWNLVCKVYSIGTGKSLRTLASQKGTYTSAVPAENGTSQPHCLY